MKTMNNEKHVFHPVNPEDEQISGGVIFSVLPFVAGAIFTAASAEIIRDWNNFKAGLLGNAPVE